MSSKLAFSSIASCAARVRNASPLRAAHPALLGVSAPQCRGEHMSHIRHLAASGDLQTAVKQEASTADDEPDKVDAASQPTRPVEEEKERYTMDPEGTVPDGDPSSSNTDTSKRGRPRKPHSGQFVRGPVSVLPSVDDVPAGHPPNTAFS